ncbi:MAG: hypothetical protein Q8S09_06020 [Hyphomonas sp.]|nr:hypothetical protein [Hyphomonas sp.]
MGRTIKTAVAVGFTVLVERAVRGYLDRRAEKRALAKAARTGFGTSTR